MTCPVCATAVVPGARFCFHCGAAVASAPDGEVERRVVTVLFGDLSEFTAWAEDLDPERVGVVTDRVLAALADAVTGYGGHVDKLTGDGIMAVFGAPTAHEEDPERAVRAAAAMQTAVRRLVEAEQGGGRRLGLRVGINTGEVLAGVQAALSYTVVGDTVNTASRLSDAARVGAVLAGRATAVATMATASWRALPPLRLKGKREPVAAYELAELRGSAARFGGGESTATVGRDAELGLLIGRFLDVTDRCTPGTLLLTGEAGIGKTRLAADLARFVGELPPARVLWGRCTPFGEGRDLAPLADLVRTACGVEDDGDEAEAESRVRRTVARLEHPAYGGWVPERLAERLLSLLGLAPVPEAPRGAAVPGPRGGGASAEVEGAVALLSALAADGPLLLVVDDLGLAGRVTLRMFAELCRGVTGPVLTLGAGRPELLLPLAEFVEALPGAELIPLLPLEDAAAERLLRAYLGGAELAPPVRAAVLERAQGNPFFLAELLHLLVDRGLLARQDDTWVLLGEPPVDLLPAGVQAVLAARIDSLDTTAKAVLRDASVLGDRARRDALQALGHLDPDRLGAALDQLVARGILRPDGQHGYAFGHTLVRDVAYAGLAKADRARRHAAAATWAAACLTGAPEDVDTVVAGHADRAGALAAEMALPASDPAWSARGAGFAAAARLGQAALGRDDHRGAEEQLSRALRLGGAAAPGDLVAAARLAHAEALAGLRRLDEAEQDLSDALGSTVVGLRAGALVVLGDVRRKRGDRPGARTAFVSALAAASDAGLDRVAGEAIRQLGLLDYFSARFAAADARFGEALELARRVRDQRGEGWALQHLAWSATTRGLWDTADAALRDAAAVFGALQDTDGLSWCAGTEALIRVLEGRLAEARAVVSGLIPLAQSMAQAWEVAACLTIDALAAAELGELSVADAEASEAVARFGATADPWGSALALCAQGIVARGLAQTGVAVARLEQAVAVATEGGHRAVAVLALTVLGLTHLDAWDQGGPPTVGAAAADPSRAGGPAALAAAEQVNELLQGQLRELELGPGALLGPRVLQAQVLRARGRRDEAEHVLRAVLTGLPGRSLIFPYRQALGHLAGILVELGRPAEALRTAREAREAPGEDVRSQVVALRALAAALTASGDPAAARSALEQARALAYATEQVSERAATDRALAAAGRGVC